MRARLQLVVACALAACGAERDAAVDAASDAADTVETVETDTSGAPDAPDTSDTSDLDTRGDTSDTAVLADVARPLLHVAPAELPGLRALAASPEPAAAALWARVVALAEAPVPAWPEVDPWEGPTAVVQARIAEAAALVGLVHEDAAASARAAAIVATPFPDPTPLNDGLLPTSDWNLWESEALVALCHAWDLVLAAPDLDPGARAAAAAQLAARVTTFERLTLEPGAFHTFLLFARNNHVLKALGALGTCGLALPERPGAARAVAEGVTGLAHVLFEVQATPDGGYAEGWGYFVYGAATWLPLVSAYQRAVGVGGAMTLVGEGTLTPSDPRAGAARLVPDLAAHPTFAALNRAALQSARPDGYVLPLDDSNVVPLLGTLAAALLDEPALAWNAALTGHPSAPLEALSFIAAARAPAAAEPTWPRDEVLADAGLAILRSDRTADATLLVMLGEHGPARLNGLGHEHADALALILHAHGEPLLLDPGYIAFEQHERVRAGRDHNLVLVDGQGPPFPTPGGAPGGDAFLGPLAHDAAAGTTSVLGRARYGGVTVWRRVVRVAGAGRALFVVADRVAPDDGAAHALALSWHGLGGGDVPDGTFAATAHGARWARPRATLDVVVAPTSGPGLVTSRPEEHALAHGTFGWHDALDVAAPAPVGAAETSGFLTILRPAPVGAEPASFTLTHPTPGVAVITVAEADGRDRLVLVARADPVELVLDGAAYTLAPGLHALDRGLAWPLEGP